MNLTVSPHCLLLLWLQVGQLVVVGKEWGRVRSLKGTGGKATPEALPGQPAEIAGLRGLPLAGDHLMVSGLGLGGRWNKLEGG